MQAMLILVIVTLDRAEFCSVQSAERSTSGLIPRKDNYVCLGKLCRQQRPTDTSSATQRAKMELFVRPPVALMTLSHASLLFMT